MSSPVSESLTSTERTILELILDTLLPPDGHFPAPSETDMIDDFILKHLPASDASPPYPGVDLAGLRLILGRISEDMNMTAALEELERDEPDRFQALWALAVFGYYSRPAVIEAIQHDLKPAYHGAPLPHGYAHVIVPGTRRYPLQMPVAPPGHYIATEDVRRVDLGKLEGVATDEQRATSRRADRWRRHGRSSNRQAIERQRRANCHARSGQLGAAGRTPALQQRIRVCPAPALGPQPEPPQARRRLPCQPATASM